jgi:ACS family glucarate transporter-like MFS transporter
MPRTRYRRRVMVMLFLLSTITFIDRVSISLAGPRIEEELHLAPEQWGWVLGAFAIAYAVFEIPSGAMGDRIGPRKVLFRIVLWWSAFTSLTGFAGSISVLLPVRFLFGAGEAGAYPNMSASISRWFPMGERGQAHGLVWMASRVGGALSPFLVIPIQIAFGWRAAFLCFGFLGVIWAIVWRTWYRDYPAQNPAVSQAEIEEIGAFPPGTKHALPWCLAMRSANLWYILVMYFAYGYCTFFFVSWMPTYLVKGRGFSETGMLFSTLPFVLGMVATCTGGCVSDALVRGIGLKWGRRAVGIAGLGSAAMFTVAAILSANRYVGVIFLALSYAGSDLMLPVAWAVCVDVGKKYAGAVTAIMNTAGGVSGFISGVVFGYFVQFSTNWLPALGLPVHSGARDFRYDVPLVPVALMLAISAAMWLKIDATRELISEKAPELSEPSPMFCNTDISL